MKAYYMTYTTSRKNAQLHSSSATGPIEYYMESYLMASKIALRAGDSKSSPMVAFAKLASFSGKHNSIGLGDFTKEKEDAGSLLYEELIREKNVFRRSDYSFTASSPSGGRSQYIWMKDMSKKISTSYRCVEDGGRVVAEMHSGGALNWKNGGSIGVTEGLDQGLERLLIVSALSIWAVEGIMGWSLAKSDGKIGSPAKDADAQTS
jgi:hypothetical protein